MFTYIIWSPQGEKPPTQTYNRRWQAECEAKRLSNKFPDKVFHVCKIKSATIAGQTAYFGKWRPKKWKQPWQNWKPAEEVNVAVSEADLIDENLGKSLNNLGESAGQCSDMLYRLGMAGMLRA